MSGCGKKEWQSQSDPTQLHALAFDLPGNLGRNSHAPLVTADSASRRLTRPIISLRFSAVPGGCQERMDLRHTHCASDREQPRRKPKTQARRTAIFHGPAARWAARRSYRGRYPGRYDPGSLRQLLRREAGQAGCDQNPARHLDQSPDQGLAQALVAALAQALIPALAEAGIRLSLPGPAGHPLAGPGRPAHRAGLWNSALRHLPDRVEHGAVNPFDD